MSDNFQEILSQLFREIEIDLGSTDLCILALEALLKAVEDLKGQDIHHFFEQLKELTTDVEETKPKYAVIIDSFYGVLRLAFNEDVIHPEKNCPLEKRKFISCMAEIIKEKKRTKRAIVKQSEKIDIEGRNILLYSHSHTIQDVLVSAKNHGKTFNVILAEQDPDKTGEVIQFLHTHKIPFRVVPSYMISQMMDEIDMLFISALTLKSTMDFVMDTGANALISQLHLEKIPTYVFITSHKFSLWRSEKRTEIYKHVHRRKHHLKSIDFERIKFSHDRVDSKIVNKIVTEQGIYTPKQIHHVYKKKLDDRLKLEQRVELFS